MFDGPNEPIELSLKRGHNAAPSLRDQDYLAKDLFKLLELSINTARYEAEVECELLQIKELVDAVLSEGVDSIMFSCIMTLSN